MPRSFKEIIKSIGTYSTKCTLKIADDDALNASQLGSSARVGDARRPLY
jgi:hypothetical protein